jgi:hypothetical protein
MGTVCSAIAGCATANKSTEINISIFFADDISDPRSSIRCSAWLLCSLTDIDGVV